MELVEIIPGYLRTIASREFKDLIKDQNKIVIMGHDDGKIYGVFVGFKAMLEKIENRKTRKVMMCYFPRDVEVTEFISDYLTKKHIYILSSRDTEDFTLKAGVVETLTRYPIASDARFHSINQGFVRGVISALQSRG